MEDVHHQWGMGYHHVRLDCKNSLKGDKRSKLDANSVQYLYWVETKGKTLEEIDAIFEGEKHSSVPDIEDIRTGRKTVDVTQIELELHEDVGLKEHEA